MKKKHLFIEVGILGILVSLVSSAFIGILVKQKEVNIWKKYSEKHLALMILLNQWLRTKQDGSSVIDYLHKYNMKTIAIYGMGYIGETLLRELKNTDIKVSYGIDQNADGMWDGINIVSGEKTLEKVDGIIVTAITFYDEIKEKLANKVECPVISLEDILYEI